MKKKFLPIVAFLFCMISFAQDNTKQKLVYDKHKKVYDLETACGTSMLKMKGKGCTLAVKYNDKFYFV